MVKKNKDFFRDWRNVKTRGDNFRVKGFDDMSPYLRKKNQSLEGWERKEWLEGKQEIMKLLKFSEGEYVRSVVFPL